MEFSDGDNGRGNMSVLIKGMDMPKSCGVCRFNGVYCYAKGDEDAHSTLPCPLVPVPPHGRMVDAGVIASEMDKEIGKNDQLMALCENAGDTRNYFNLSKVQIGLLSARHMVKNAPTIIPADEGE